MLVLRERWYSRKWRVVQVVSGVLIAVCVVFAVWNIAQGKETKGVDVATLLGVPIGMTSLVVAVVALRRPVEDGGAGLAREHAKALAKQVLDSEGAVRRQLLGDDTQGINVAYVLHSAAERAAAAPSAGLTFSDGPAGLPDVLDYYRATRPRRLVVTGAAGAGKTVLALELMQALIEGRSESDPVPVRIPLAQWDTTQPLATLLVRRLTDAYGVRAEKAAGLVAHGMVLPVLDGLDEMDPLRADGTPDPEAPRARAALEVLNAYQSGREAGPLVLTCRTGHYDALAPVSRLIDAARIAIAPVDTRNAVAYLRARARDRARWQPLTDHLEAQPTGPLATTLSTPWRLCLTATVYHRDGDPAELLRHTSGHDLDQHLLARYLPAATTNTHNPRGYRPEDVHRWLHHLTKHLTGTTTRAPATDLTLHRLWPLAGTTRTRITDLLLTTLTTTVPLVALSLSFPGPVSRTELVLDTVLGVFVGVITFRPTPKPNRLRINRGTLQGRLRTRFWTGFRTWFAVGVAFGVAFGVVMEFPNWFTGFKFGIGLGIGTGVLGGFMGGLAGGFANGFKAWFRISFMVGFVSGLGIALAYNYKLPGFADALGDHSLIDALSSGLWLGLVFGIVGGLAGGFLRGLRAEPTTLANPRDIIRDDMIYGLLVVPPTGILAMAALTMVALPMLNVELTTGVAVQCSAGLVVGLGSSFGRSSRRYAMFLLCSRGRLPFRLGVFLDWAVTAGLLRYNGPSYQFRHRELQQWLSQHPHR